MGVLETRWLQDVAISFPGVKSAPPLQRPERAELETLWSDAVAVTSVLDVASWLQQRALSPGVVADRDLARALRPDAQLPAWARYRGTPWTESGHRLLVPMYGASGVLESVHSRNVFALDPKGRDKSASPAGCQVRGLVMADALARQLLQKGRCPEWWKAPRLIVAEGVPDFLTWASVRADADDVAPAVIGIIAGAWTGDIAARIPAECRVLVQTHADDAGRKYAGRIAGSLHGRCADVRVPEGTVVELPGGMHA